MDTGDDLLPVRCNLVEFRGGEEGKTEEECYQSAYNYIKEIVPTLPKAKGWVSEHMVQYQGIWLSPLAGLKGVIIAHRCFNALHSDIFLATFPKSGTTWFKALIFSIINRTRFKSSEHPLLINGPHDCIPFLETLSSDIIPQLNIVASPRLFSTHVPYTILPNSMINGGCRIVYVCRDPKDVLVSQWHYLNKLRSKELPPLSLEDAFELFSNGITHCGSCWDHVLGYWNASLQSTNRILFLHYEDMKRDPIFTIKKLAEFLGEPFSLVEEKEGVVHEIVNLCSFQNLSNLEVNRTGVKLFGNNSAVENSNFFRHGQIGDSKNHLTHEMIECLDGMTQEKFNGSGLIMN